MGRLVAELLIIVVIVGIILYLSSGGSLLNINLIVSHPPAGGVTTSTPPELNSTLNELIQKVLEKINQEREKLGLPPVRYVFDESAVFRAEDQLKREYFGHCSPEGLIPPYYYTKFGGLYYMEENIAYYYVENLPMDPINYSLKNLDLMLYNDSASGWGHRDSLLDPTNNYASVYAVWNSNRLFLVIDMLKVWVDWVSPPELNGTVFSVEGFLLLNNSRITSAVIYYHDLDTAKSVTYSERLNINVTCRTYSLGYPYAGVVPKPFYFESIPTIRPDDWVMKGNYFRISFNVGDLDKPGLYTIVIYAENTLGIKHPYDPGRFADSLPVLEYSFLKES